MDTGATLLADRRQTLAGCAEALRGLHEVLFQCGSADLAGLAGDLAEVRALAGAGLADVVAEAQTRGVVDASQHASASAWTADVAWHSRREAVTIAKTATILRREDLGAVAESIRQVDVDPGTAVVVAAEYDKIAPDLHADAKPVVLEQFLTVGAEHGPGGVRRLRQEILARYGEQGEFDEHQERCRRQIDLTPGRESSAGVWAYRLTLDDEGRACLEAAIGPLSAPKPHPDTGARDGRPVGRRRGEALIEALRRSAAAAGHVPTSPKAVLMLTMGLDDLTGRTGAGLVLGSRAAGTPIAPDTVRKLACDAGIIPVVLGQGGEILDQGREQRLFTPAQVRALWLRDEHCTFPGCTIPAAWADAHHLVHWADGGPTDLTNGALLCPRHHTIVHRDLLAGVVTDNHVTWDLRPGTYRAPPCPVPDTSTSPDGSLAPPLGASAQWSDEVSARAG
jgi:hypothetical protein